MTDLNDQLKALAQRSSAWVPGVRLHPDDIEQLPRAEPKPIWAGGELGNLLGTPVFADATIERGTHQIATREWIATQVAADRPCPAGCPHPYRSHGPDGCRARMGHCDVCACQEAGK